MGAYDIVSDELLFQLNHKNLGNKFLKLKNTRGLVEPRIFEITNNFNRYELHSYFNETVSKIKKISLSYLSDNQPAAIYIAISYSADTKITAAKDLLSTAKDVVYKDLCKNLKGCDKDRIKSIITMDGLYPSQELNTNEYEVMIIVLC